MGSRYFSESNRPLESVDGASNSKQGGANKGGAEKPAFGSPGLPGKKQPKDRSAGVKRIQQSPHTEGI